MYSSHFNVKSNNKIKSNQKCVNSSQQNGRKDNKSKSHENKPVILKKTIPQYLFLNLVKNLSILYLILAILNIPVYIGVVQLSQTYYQQNQQNQLSITDYIMETTLFALHQNFTNSSITIMNFTFFNSNNSNNSRNSNNSNNSNNKNLNNSTTTTPHQHQIDQNSSSSNELNVNGISFNSFTFSWTLEQFNTFVVWYFCALSIVFAIGLSFIQISNHRLFLRLKFGQNLYQKLTTKNKSTKTKTINSSESEDVTIIQRENFHIISISNIPSSNTNKDWPLYILIPKILSQIKQKMEAYYKITGYRFMQPKIRIVMRKNHQKYLKTIHRIHQLSIKIKELQQKIRTQKKQVEFNSQNSSLQQELNKLVQELRDLQLTKIKAKINLDSTSQQQSKNFNADISTYRNCYYYPHLFLKFDHLWDVPLIKIIKNLKAFKQIQNISLFQQYKKQQFNCFQKNDFQIMFQRLVFNNYEKEDIIYQNFEKQRQHVGISTYEFQNANVVSTFISFLQKIVLRIRFNFKRYTKIFFVYLISIVLVIGIDIVILIIQKSNIFSYSTSLITLILQILLKGKIIFISNLQGHKLWSHLHLSIFIKITLLLYFNLCLLLIIGNYDWTTLWIKNALSKNFVKNIGDLNWYSRVGVTLILLLIIQTLYCTIRVYIEIGKSLLFGFIQTHFSTFSLSRLPSRLKSYLQQFQVVYVKPIIDLQICYSHILSVYLTGITFSYPFPILYPLMLIFSLLIYSTHVNYVELHTQKLMYNGRILLNNASIRFLFLGAIGGIVIMQAIQSEVYFFNINFVIISVIILAIMILTQIYIRNFEQKLQVRLFQIKTSQNQSQSQQKQIKNMNINISFCDQFNKPQIIQKQIIDKKNVSFSFSQTTKIKQQLFNIQLQMMALRMFNNQNCLNQPHLKYFNKYQNILMAQHNQLQLQLRQKQKQKLRFNNLNKKVQNIQNPNPNKLIQIQINSQQQSQK